MYRNVGSIEREREGERERTEKRGVDEEVEGWKKKRQKICATKSKVKNKF